MAAERSLDPITADLTQNQIRNWHITIGKIALYEKGRPGSIRLYVMYENPLVICVGLKLPRMGTWLFDANSTKERKNVLEQEGFWLEENPTDMILSGARATISEVNKKLPGFLRRNHPDLARLLDLSRQRVISKKARQHAA